MEYFQNIYFSKVNDNNFFWKTVKPRFSSKCKTRNAIILAKEDTIVKNEKLIADFIKSQKHSNFDGQSLSSIN